MKILLDKPCLTDQALPITVEQYHALDAAGEIGSDVELLWGVIVKKMSKSPLHRLITRRLVTVIEAQLKPNSHVCKEEPLSIDGSEPEPDISVIAGTPEDYLTSHPTTAALVAEIAISSIELDREKAELYAKAGVPEYWLVIPEQKKVIVYTEIVNDRYKNVREIAESDTLDCSSLEGVQINLAELLGSATIRNKP